MQLARSKAAQDLTKKWDCVELGRTWRMASSVGGRVFRAQD